MQRAGDIVLIVAPVFHNVDFTAGGPAGCTKTLSLPISAGFGNIFTEHPDRGPGPWALRQFGAHFNTAIGKRVFRIESCRGVLLGHTLIGVTLFFGDYFQGAVTDIGVCGTICVVLDLTVIPGVAIG